MTTTIAPSAAHAAPGLPHAGGDAGRARPPALAARGLRLTHPGAPAPALDGIDLVVEPGTCHALLGPNGAGKTTLIRTATGLAAPDAGDIRIAGGDPRRAAVRRQLGVMLQETAFPTHLTVGELVAGAAERAGLPAAAALPVLDEVGIADLAGRRTHQLSGGQRRRLQLARALVVDPALLVLDEPTEGLDVDARRTTWERLAARRDRGTAILLTTHLIEEAHSVADRVAVIDRGRIVADERPATLVDRLPDRTIDLHTAIGAARLRELPGVVAVRAEADAGPDGRTRTSIVTRRPEDVVRRLLSGDRGAHGLRVTGASLEDAVAALVDRHATAVRA